LHLLGWEVVHLRSEDKHNFHGDRALAYSDEVLAGFYEGDRLEAER